MRFAESQLGTQEVPGPKSNPKILSWAQKLGIKILGIPYTDDDTAWCGLFCAAAMQVAGFAPPKIAIRAKAWALWGAPLEVPVEGAVLVFERPGGGHVGFYAGETSTAYRVLGGNQGNAVSYTWIAKDRCIAIRWPPNLTLDGTRRLAEVSGPIGALSTDEA